ncbi:MAG: DUF2125 domain-containing protein [Labrys sp. (in: a-proteobacteria)]
MIDAPDPAVTRRNKRRIMAPFFIFLLIAAAWSAFWFYAAGEIETRLDAALERSAAEGRAITCTDRSVSGFPFRFELRCTTPTLSVNRDDERFTLVGGRLTGVAQIYQPQHVIFQLEGPVTLASPDMPRTLQVRFTSAEASAVLSFGGPDRVSLVLRDVEADVGDDASRVLLLGKSSFEAHLRASPAPDAKPGTYDLASRLDCSALPAVDAELGPAPMKLEVQGTITGMSDWSSRPFPDRLRAWQASGGTLRIVLAQIDRAETSAKATGDVALDAEGRPAGKLFVALSGAEVLADKLKERGLIKPNVAQLFTVGLSMLGKPSNIDGKPAVEVPLTLRDGRASLGAFPVGNLDPLY